MAKAVAKAVGVAIFCSNLAAGRASRINGNAEQTRDYVYVEDVARANVLSLEKAVPSGTCNLGTGVETSVNRLYDLLQNASGMCIPDYFGPEKPGEQLRNALDGTLAARMFGWRPEVDLVSGLRSTIEFFEHRSKR